MKTLAIVATACLVLGMGGTAFAEQGSLEIGASSTQLTNGRPAWDESYMLLTERGSAGRPTFYQRFAESDRFGQHDAQVDAGAWLTVAPGTLLDLELADSATHRTLPAFASTLGLEHRFSRGYGAMFGFTERRYTATSASIAALGGDRYVGAYRFSYNASLARLARTPGTAVTHTLSATRYTRDGGDVTIRAYAGRDVENVGSAVLVMDVRGATVEGHLPLTHTYSLAYGLDAFAQGRLYSGKGAHLGIRRSF